MLIVSQDKDNVINHDKVMNTWIENEYEEFNIYSDGELLGKYKTKKRAKEVLQEIINAYLDCNKESFYANFAYVKNIVYEMPTK